MAWTDPHTWVTNELVTAALLNTELRDNLNALKEPPTAIATSFSNAPYDDSGTSFADIHSSDFSLTLPGTDFAGGDVMIVFGAYVSSTSGTFPDIVVTFDVEIDDTTRLGSTTGGLARAKLNTSGSGAPNVLYVSFCVLATGLAAEEDHTFKMQWAVDTSGNARINATTSTPTPIFWVREI